jgi:hypothetical protein
MVSLNPHVAKILANVLRRKVERKTEDVLEEDESQY